MVNKYSFNIEWSDEDQEYMATCPAFSGLSAFGATEEEALHEAKIALDGFIQTYQANRMALPEPIVRTSYSGKLQLRLEKTLHRLTSQAAEAQGVSLNTYIADAVQAKVSGEQVAHRILTEVRMAVASSLTVSPRKTQYTETVRQLSIEGMSVTNGERRKDN